MYIIVALQILIVITDINLAIGAGHYNYFSGLKTEDKQSEELILDIKKTKTLDKEEPIFTDQIIESLEQRYSDIFGYSSAEKNLQLSRFNVELAMQRSNSEKLQEIHRKQNRFANFMLKKITEKKLDLYLQNDPKLKKIYEAKHKLSNYEVETKRGWKFSARYSISGNFTRLQYAKGKTKLYAQFEGDNSKSIYAFKYPLARKLEWASYYNRKEESLQMVLTRSLSPVLSVNLSVLNYIETPLEKEKSDTYLTGLNYLWF